MIERKKGQTMFMKNPVLLIMKKLSILNKKINDRYLQSGAMPTVRHFL